MATSFYNERNEDIASDLVKNLIECKQAIPEFLKEFRPDGELEFDDDSDGEFFDNGSAAGADTAPGSVSDGGRLDDEVQESEEVAYSDAGSGKGAEIVEGNEGDAAYNDRETRDEPEVLSKSKSTHTRNDSWDVDDRKSQKKGGLGDSAWAPAPSASKAPGAKPPVFWG
jgi:hypothetical protein